MQSNNRYERLARIGGGLLSLYLMSLASLISYPLRETYIAAHTYADSKNQATAA